MLEVKKTVSKENSSGGSSYGQILKSSSIVGGAQAINYIIGLVRTKVVAVLLGPSGVGLVSLYVSTVGLMQTFSQFGINESGVREIAVATGSNNPSLVAQTVKTLRRVCWLTGIFGWGLTVLLAWPLSKWVCGSTEHVWAIVILGGVVLLELVSSGQKALLQGVRRVGDLARIQIAFALLSTVLAIGIYWWLGERGIVPVILVTSVVQLGVSWWFARRVQVAAVFQPWSHTLRNSRALFKLGSAFMYGGLLAAGVGLAIRALIVRDLGISDAGIYQAAWALSGLFGTFIIKAMGTDFYPRLTAVCNNTEEINRLVSEQIHVGVMLALPGIVATVSFASLIVQLFYSEQFLFAANLLPWFVFGFFGMIVMFPMGMIQRARSATKWIYVGQTEANVGHVLLVLLLLPKFGLMGVAYAFAAHIALHCLVTFVIAHRLTGYKLTLREWTVLAVPALMVLPVVAAAFTGSATLHLIVGICAVASSVVYSMRALGFTLGKVVAKFALIRRGAK